MALKFGTSKASVTVTGIDEQIMKDLLQRTVPGQVEEMEEALDKIHTDAFDAWPKAGDPGYDSSRSRASDRFREQPWRKEQKRPPGTDKRGSAYDLKTDIIVDLQGSNLIGRIYSDNPYARYIKANSLGGRSAFVSLLRTPFRKAAKKIAKAMGKRMAEDLNDG